MNAKPPTRIAHETRSAYIWLVDRIYDTVEEEIARCWRPSHHHPNSWRHPVHTYIEAVKTLEPRKADDVRSGV